MQKVEHSASRKQSEEIAWAESEATDETTYLLSSKANAERLLKSIDNLRAGQTLARRLITLAETPPL
ncbi:hypothetical protein [Pseudomonas sp. NPDC099000]|uniref:hypothetical protein n=1 Tax=Pseudomonas sp. NPDC099000 TaxID=3364488 RepID=UPI00383A824C